MTTTEMLAYLNRDGNLRVPCSRYGSDTATCSVVAAAVAVILERETGEAADLDHVMGLVVNDHDDIEYLIDNYTETDGSIAL